MNAVNSSCKMGYATEDMVVQSGSEISQLGMKTKGDAASADVKIFEQFLDFDKAGLDKAGGDDRVPIEASDEETGAAAVAAAAAEAMTREEGVENGIEEERSTCATEGMVRARLALDACIIGRRISPPADKAGKRRIDVVEDVEEVGWVSVGSNGSKNTSKSDATGACDSAWRVAGLP
jgi:hypothetical protein